MNTSFAGGKPIEPLKLLANLPRDVLGDVGLGSHSALTEALKARYYDCVQFAHFDARVFP